VGIAYLNNLSHIPPVSQAKRLPKQPRKNQEIFKKSLKRARTSTNKSYKHVLLKNNLLICFSFFWEKERKTAFQTAGLFPKSPGFAWKNLKSC